MFDISTPFPEGGEIGFESMLDSNSSGIFKSTLAYIDTCNLKDLNGNSIDSDSIYTYLINNEPIIIKKKWNYSNDFFQIRFKNFPLDKKSKQLKKYNDNEYFYHMNFDSLCKTKNMISTVKHVLNINLSFEYP